MFLYINICTRVICFLEVEKYFLNTRNIKTLKWNKRSTTINLNLSKTKLIPFWKISARRLCFCFILSFSYSYCWLFWFSFLRCFLWNRWESYKIWVSRKVRSVWKNLGRGKNMTEIHYRKKYFTKINTIAKTKDEFNNI